LVLGQPGRWGPTALKERPLFKGIKSFPKLGADWPKTTWEDWALIPNCGGVREHWGLPLLWKGFLGGFWWQGFPPQRLGTFWEGVRGGGIYLIPPWKGPWAKKGKEGGGKGLLLQIKVGRGCTKTFLFGG